MSMQEKLRKLPKMDNLLMQEDIIAAIEKEGRNLVLNCLREALDSVRQDILAKKEINDVEKEVMGRFISYLQFTKKMNLRQVINATGIVLHTNIGRAVLSKKAREAVNAICQGYCNLEINLETGKRGSRYSHVENLLKEITGCEDAMVVNNNAAAVLLALDTMAKDGETIVSRGQLVEIGGSFRIPSVMKMGGTRLVEVGTTNKTHLWDYTEAITEETKVLMKVHTSNYRITGFAEEVSTEELVELGKENGLPVIEDLGSGFLADLKIYGITGEPRVQDIIKAGVDVVTFSGDKLLGGPQAGIIVGKKEYVSKMKRNQLARALRVDKMTMAALEATLKEYLDMDKVMVDNPTLRMLSCGEEILKFKAEKLCNELTTMVPGARYTVEKDYSKAGGGSLPDTELETYIVVMHTEELSEEALGEALRINEPAILTRKKHENIIFDVRTIEEEDIPLVATLVKNAFDSLMGE